DVSLSAGARRARLDVPGRGESARPAGQLRRVAAQARARVRVSVLGCVVRHRGSRAAARGGQPDAPVGGAARARRVLPGVNAAILGARFLLELCLLAALAYTGLQVNVVVAILAP